jgi:trans-2-enoyl-CoA reductase
MLPTAALIFKDIRFSGFWVSRWGDKHRGERKRTVDEILDLVRRGEFKDTPTQELTWNWDTEENLLKDAVKGTLSGFRAGKSVLVFGDT